MMIYKRLSCLVLLLSIVLIPKISFSQLRTFDFEQIDSLRKIEKRICVVFIHTDWCNYCKAMKNKTLKNDSVINKLNKQFYFIELNAEEKSEITFNNHTFKYKPTGTNTGIHELAEQLAFFENKISYPTLCFLNPDFKIIYQYNQFINSKELILILNQLDK